MRFEVLVEGASDVPVVREVFTRRFGMTEIDDFRIHGHKGKGRLPADPLSPPPIHLRGLLDQLPAKLRGFSHLREDECVLVLVDVDDESCVALLAKLNDLLERLPRRPPRVLFRLAIEETESWFIADHAAVLAAYPKAQTAKLRKIQPDAIVGAWEVLASALKMDPIQVTGESKYEWATRISPHLDLDSPASMSLRKLVDGIEREIRQAK